MQITHRLVAATLAGSLLVGGAGSAFAAGKHAQAPRFAVAGGVVSNLSAAGFTVTQVTKTRSVAGTTTAPATKTVQVSMAATTKLAARAGTTGTLANGDYVLVIGSKTTTGVAANRVIFSVKAFNTARAARVARAQHTLAVARMHRVAGTVTAATATSLTIQTRSGRSITLAIAAKTRFALAGALQTVAPALTSGEKVTVRFTRDAATKTLVATAINITATA